MLDIIVAAAHEALHFSDSSTENDCLVLLENIIRSLMEYDENISKRKQRYFNDSLHHRIKNRILQCLLVFQFTIKSFYDKFNSNFTKDIKSSTKIKVDFK